MDGRSIVALLGAALSLGACGSPGTQEAWEVETDVEPDDAMACFKHRYQEDPVFMADDVTAATRELKQITDRCLS